jgi:hypothetical protein
MRKQSLLIICVMLAFLLSVRGICYASIVKRDSTNTKNSKDRNSSAKALFVHYMDDIYQTARLELAGLDSSVFQKAVTGYYNLKIVKRLPAASSILAIIDFSKPATASRMWIIDMQSKKLLINCAVVQGRGNTTADATSTNEQHQKILGFYITNEIYQSKYGTSLRLDGMDAGVNENALEKEIVLTGSTGTVVNNYCPAVPANVLNEVAGLLKNKNLLFINDDSVDYTSKYLNEDQAAKFAHADSSFNLVKDAFIFN